MHTALLSSIVINNDLHGTLRRTASIVFSPLNEVSNAYTRIDREENIWKRAPGSLQVSVVAWVHNFVHARPGEHDERRLAALDAGSPLRHRRHLRPPVRSDARVASARVMRRSSRASSACRRRRALRASHVREERVRDRCGVRTDHLDSISCTTRRHGAIADRWRASRIVDAARSRMMLELSVAH